ncbi:MAG TPA: magnesium transporter [Syntrophorhabdaceae bacterium]|nr:magnesium transporter [Pseudomonadota bacterium]HOS58559.1 magnesium transporter [Syntrophorhabdaceae bacterium]HPN98872.1 magnesium transporter [Syntrophorhabdaceae bacterium]HQG50869.1 magnesium transporter [Syntrophorhabdaceae bacterium]HQJ94977.1 magnesium transporter [Syntrophorhabdaceae bacterium]
MNNDSAHLNTPVINIARSDVTKLRHNYTVQQAMDEIRQTGLGERIIYFYIVDDDERLVGVLPTRRLLTAPTDMLISEIMITNLITIPQHVPVSDAYEFFVLHKFLAFPVVDEQKRILGMVDISMFTEDTLDAADRESMNRMFEMIGFHTMQVRESSSFRAFQFRFPWLIATIASGTVCALLASVYEMTLAKSLILAFFLTLVLGLGESVSVQSMSLTVYSLHVRQPDWIWYIRAFYRETGAAMLLGTTCGSIVGLLAWLWRGEGIAALVIGASIFMILCAAVFWGLSVPSVLHKLKLDLKISAGPLTLALTDISTILIYFGLAKLLL